MGHHQTPHVARDDQPARLPVGTGEVGPRVPRPVRLPQSAAQPQQGHVQPARQRARAADHLNPDPARVYRPALACHCPGAAVTVQFWQPHLPSAHAAQARQQGPPPRPREGRSEGSGGRGPRCLRAAGACAAASAGSRRAASDRVYAWPRPWCHTLGGVQQLGAIAADRGSEHPPHLRRAKRGRPVTRQAQGVGWLHVGGRDAAVCERWCRARRGSRVLVRNVLRGRVDWEGVDGVRHTSSMAPPVGGCNEVERAAATGPSVCYLLERAFLGCTLLPHRWVHCTDTACG